MLYDRVSYFHSRLQKFKTTSSLVLEIRTHQGSKERIMGNHGGKPRHQISGLGKNDRRLSKVINAQDNFVSDLVYGAHNAYTNQIDEDESTDAAVSMLSVYKYRGRNSPTFENSKPERTDSQRPNLRNMQDRVISHNYLNRFDSWEALETDSIHPVVTALW